MKFPLLARALVCLGLFVVRASAQVAATSAVPNVSVTIGASANVTPVTAAGGTAPYTYAIAPGLPAGLALDATTGVLSGAAALSAITPPFIGFEGFSGDASKWAYEFHFDSTSTNGALTFANSRLEFTKGAGAGSDVRGWDGDPSSAASRTSHSYNQSWVSDITVSHTFTAGANEFASFGFEVTNANGKYSALMVVNAGGVARVRAEGSGATATEVNLPSGTTLTRLRLQWDAAAKILRAYYSTDSGATYSLLYSFLPDAQWGAASTAGFAIEVFGNSNAAAAIPSGAMWGDNFKMSASAATTETVTVTDAATGTASATFALTVNPPALTATTAVATVPAVTGVAVTPTTPVTAGGGLTPYTYSVFPALPAGLTIDSATGQLSGTPAAGTSTPLFVGADDFNSGSDAKWAYFFQQGTTNGALTFTNGRLDFTKGAGNGNYFLGWDGDPLTANSRTTASTATNWVADITVTNTASSANETYTIGFEAAGVNQWGAVMLSNQNGVLSVIGDGANTTPVSLSATSNTNVRLRLTWDATAQLLKSYCSFDNGATYTLVRSYSPFAEWTAGSLNNGFFFEVFARSTSAAAIAAGSMYADNFSVAATGPATAVHTMTVGDRVGTFANSTFKVIVRNTPVVTSVSPAAALPGSTVTLSGTDLAETSSVTFGGISASFTYNAANGTLTATVPSGARTGQVVVTTPAGTSAPVAYTVPLAITSQPTHNVVTTGQATSFGVILAGGAQGGTYTYQWRRNGAAISGATNAIYYVPAVSAADVGDYDVVVSDGTSTLTSGPAALRIATSNVWQWRNRLPTGSDFNAVAFGAGRYVAVGSAGTIVTSTDAVTWTALAQQPPALFLNVACNGSQFLIVGTNGNVLRSTDGVTWTQGNVGANVSLFGLAYGNGRWVTTGFSSIFTSTDGITWTKQAFSVGATINAVTATPTGFIAVTSGGHVITGDTTGTTWTSTQPLAGTSLIDVAYANGTTVIGARTKVYSSTNGTSWTAATLPTSDPGIDWGRILATSTGFTVAGASYVTTSPTPRGYIIQSTDGVNWALRTLPGVAGLQGITSGPQGIVAVGVIGEIVTSTDGLSWNVPAGGLRLPGDLFAGATGPAGSLFAGVGGNVFWSADHLTNWTQVNAGTAYTLYGATFAAGKYVLVGGNDTTSAPAAAVLTSTTGNSGWTKVDLTGASYLAALAFDARVGRFVAAGDGASLYWAADPAGTWTAVNKPANAVLRAGVAANGRYVFVGDNGTVFTSTDAANWTTANSGTTVSLQAIAYGNGRFVAAGSNSTAASIRTVIITSTDGITWQNVAVPFTGSVRSLMFADGRFIAVGGTSTVLLSSDGLTWSADTAQFAGLFRAILRTPEGYLAGGTGGSIASVAAPKATAGAAQTVSIGEAATFTAATAASGHAPYTFSVSPALPQGLMLDPNTGVISGTPVSGAAALFAGGDNFATGSDAKWAYYFRTAGAGTANGMLSFTNGRLDFSKGAGAGTYFLGWDGDADPATPTARTTASFATSWVADLTVTNTYTAATNEYADIGLEAAGGSSQFSSILLLNRGGSLFIRCGGSGASVVETPVTATTGVRLRLTWDAGTKVLTASYSTDNGATYTTATTFTPATSWTPGTAAAGFYFEVFGESNAAAAIAAGSLYADDFGVRTTSPTTTIHTVSVTDSLGLIGTANLPLTVLAGPSITGISPATSSAGATVTLTGSQLTNVNAVSFGSIPATSFTVVSDTQITAVVPSGATTGPVTVRTSGGATVSSSTALTVLVAPALVDQPANRRITAGGSVEWRVSATGSTPFTYEWRKDGQVIAGATGAALKLSPVTASQAGVYTVRVSNSVSSATSQNATLTVLTPDPILWQQFTEFSTEQAPGRTVHAGGYVYVPWSALDRLPDIAAGRLVGALARFSEADGTLDTSFRLAARYRAATHVAASGTSLVIAVRTGDASTVIRTNAAGVPDTTFTAPLFARGIRFVAVQSDGKVIVVATDNLSASVPAGALGTSGPAVFRLNADGTLDTTFTAAVLGAGANIFGAPVVDAQGRIYLAGFIPSVNGTARANLARLNSDGTLDATYAAPASLPTGFTSNQARAVLLQSDGRAVFVGDFATATRGTVNDPIMAIRLTTAGQLDTAFAMPLRSQLGLLGQRLRAAVVLSDDSIVGVSDRLVRLTSNGAVDTSFVVRPFDRETFWVSLGTDGRLYVPDQSGVGGVATTLSLVGNGIAKFAVNGVPDESFQTGGWGRAAHPTDGAVLSDGRVWVAGNFNRYGSTRLPGLAQFGTDGNLTSAVVASARSMTSATLAPAANDAIYAVLATPTNSLENVGPSLVRVLATGAVDSTFVPALPSGYDLNAASLYAAPSGAVLLAQGSITATAALNGATGNALVKLSASGARDTSYTPALASVAVVERNSSNAITMIRTGGLNVAQVLPDGRALVIASAVDGNLRLLRLTSTGAADSTFTAPSFGTITPAVGFTTTLTDPVTGTSGQFNLSTYSASDLVRTAVQMTDGRVYVGGRFTVSGAPRGLVRLNADGSLDTTFTGAGIANSNAAAGAYVCALASDAAGRLYVAGRFDSFNGTPVAGLFRLRPDGTLDTSWSPGFGVTDAPDAVASLVVSGERLYVFGTAGTSSDTLPSIYRIAAIPLPLVVTQAPVATTAVVGTPAALSVTATSTSAVTYQWLKGTSPITGATSSTLNFPTPALADEGLYSVALTNAAGTVTTAPVQLTVNAAPVITQQPTAATVIVGSTASFSVTATGKPAVSYQWYKGTSAITGATSATLNFPTAQTTDAGTYSVRISNSVSVVTSASVALTVNPVAPVITSAGTASAVSGRSFLYAITTNPTPVTFAASGLPAGLAVDTASGVISGVPTVTGTFNVTLQAANVTATATKPLTLTVLPPPPIINSAASATGRVNASFSYAILAVNTPSSYGASGLPAGLSLNTSTGAITGTPSAAGTYSVTLSATNAGGTTTTPFVLTIDPAPNAPVYSGTTQLSSVQNASFSFTPTFNTAGLTTTYTASGLPAGLTIASSTGAISGTPSATGTFTVNVTATNSGGATTVPFTFTVNPPPTAPRITSASVASATVGTPFSFTLTPSSPAALFNATGLPALGLTLNIGAGTISGTPTGPGTLTLAVSATNAAGTGPNAALVITINPSPNAPILTNATVAQGRVGDAFSFALTATNTPTAFAVTSGALPAGLSLNPSTGAITGTPTQAGQFAAWLAASNGNGSGYALQVVFSIAPALTTPVITSNGTAAAQVGQPFSYQILATNSPTSYAATGLPAGLTLNATSGVISGIPADATTTAVAVTLTATNASGTSTPKTLLVSVAAAAATPVITSPLSASGQVGGTFSYQITASESPTSFVALNLPAGLALNATTGAITGTPSTSGSVNVTIRAANAGGLGAASTLALNLTPAATAPAITSAAAVSGKVGVAFSYTLTTSGTATSYAVSGSLPLGLALNTSTGVISGTPAASGIFTVSLTASGTGGTSLPQSVVFNISPADNVPVITSAIYASATVGQAFTYQITAASTPAFPAAPFAAPFTLDAVNLPAGLAVNPSTGVIQGVPTTAGVFTATLVGTNSAGTGPYRDLTLFIAPAATAPVVTSTPFAAAQVGVPFTYQITGTNNPTSYDVLGAPAWLSVNTSSGALAGLPTTPGTFTVQLVATNGAGASNPLTLTLTVAPSANAPIVTSTRTATGTVSQAFSYQITAAVPNGAPGVSSFVATGLPPGVSLNPTSGLISGTPTSSGQFEVTLLAVNSAGSSQPVTLILTIQPSLQFNGGL